MDNSKRFSMRLIYSILFFLLSFCVGAQEFGTLNRIVNDGIAARGLHYYDNTTATTTEINEALTYGVVGVHFIDKWNEIETSNGVYDFSNLYDNCLRFANAGLYYTIQINTGPDAPISGATDWLADLGVSTFTTSGGNENGPYPDYYSTLYETKLHALFDALNEYIHDNFSAAMQRYLVAQYVVLGSTGDTGPWKGNSCTPSNCLGYSDDNTWKDWSMEQVGYAQQSIYNARLTHSVGYNEGNNHESLDRMYGISPFYFAKNGEYSHDINFLGETVTDRSKLIKFFLRGEAQDDILNTTHAHRDGFQMIISALCAGMDYFNVTGGWFNQVIESGESEADHRMTDYFVKYAPHNLAASSKKAFIQLADKFSFDDLDRFPEGVTYGDLIGNSTGYNNRLASINNDATLGETFKQWARIDAVRDFINSSRITAVSNYAVTQGAPAYNPSANTLAYGNPYGYSQFSNYEFHISQTNPRTTSKGAWLVGSDTSVFGQYGRKFNASGDVMSFDVDDKWAGGATSKSVDITVTYYNEGTGTWKLFARTSVGISEIFSVTNTNTTKWKQRTATVNMALGTSVDFTLNYISGDNTIFSMIELETQ